MSKLYSRRKFLSLTGLTATGALLAACGASPARERVSSTATSVPTEAPPASPTAATAAVSPAQAQAEAQVVVGDVMDYVLASDDWPGDFGQVTFKLHEAYYDGDMVYHIRTDASDPDFATANGLVYVPLLNAALAREEATSPIYTFDNGVSEQRSVLATIPGMDSFSPALVVHEVTFNGSPTLLDSVEAIKAAGLVETLQSSGSFTVFAPTNEAFAKLPAGTLDDLLKNKDELAKIYQNRGIDRLSQRCKT